MEAFEAWLQRLLWEKRIGDSADGVDILRFKAFIKFPDDAVAVYQAVGETYDCRLLPAAASVAMPTTRLVFIGRNLDHDSLKQSISCYKYKQ
jgi:G3E family GTPase